MLRSLSKGWLNNVNQYSVLLKRDGKVVDFPFKQTNHEDAIGFVFHVFAEESIIRIFHCDRSGKKISTIFEQEKES